MSTTLTTIGEQRLAAALTGDGGSLAITQIVLGSLALPSGLAARKAMTGIPSPLWQGLPDTVEPAAGSPGWLHARVALPPSLTGWARCFGWLNASNELLAVGTLPATELQADTSSTTLSMFVDTGADDLAAAVTIVTDLEGRLADTSDPAKGSALIGHGGESLRQVLERYRDLLGGYAQLMWESGPSYTLAPSEVGKKAYAFAHFSADHCDLIIPDDAEMGNFQLGNVSYGYTTVRTATGGGEVTLAPMQFSWLLKIGDDIIDTTARPLGLGYQAVVDVDDDSDIHLDDVQAAHQHITITDTEALLTGPVRLWLPLGFVVGLTYLSRPRVVNSTAHRIDIMVGEGDDPIRLPPGRSVTIHAHDPLGTPTVREYAAPERMAVVSIEAPSDSDPDVAATTGHLNNWVRAGGADPIAYQIGDADAVGWLVGDAIYLRTAVDIELTLVAGTGVTINHDPAQALVLSGAGKTAAVVCVAVDYDTGEVELDATGIFEAAI